LINRLLGKSYHEPFVKLRHIVVLAFAVEDTPFLAIVQRNQSVMGIITLAFIAEGNLTQAFTVEGIPDLAFVIVGNLVLPFTVVASY